MKRLQCTERMICIALCLAFVLMMLLPQSAFANAPVPEPGEPYTGGGTVVEMIVFMALLGAASLITIVLELLIALIFRLKPVWWVIPVNLVSNLVFNLLLIVFCYIMEMNYIGYVLVGEIIVIILEYLIYTQIYQNTGRKRLLAYSVVANTISAVLPLFAAVMVLE